jgi:hypothetical protein
VRAISCVIRVRCLTSLVSRNPGGIRFGSSELYDVIEECFSASRGIDSAHIVVDCLAVGQTIDGGADERVVLFVKLLEGQKLSPDLIQKIKGEVRRRRSPRHVPASVSGPRRASGNVANILGGRLSKSRTFHTP